MVCCLLVHRNTGTEMNRAEMTNMDLKSTYPVFYFSLLALKTAFVPFRSISDFLFRITDLYKSVQMYGGPTSFRGAMVRDIQSIFMSAMVDQPVFKGLK